MDLSQYLADGEYNKVLEGLYEIVGYADDGSMIAYESSDESSKYRTPRTQWRIASHDATEYGTNGSVAKFEIYYQIR